MRHNGILGRKALASLVVSSSSKHFDSLNIIMADLALLQCAQNLRTEESFPLPRNHCVVSFMFSALNPTMFFQLGEFSTSLYSEITNG